MENGIYNAFRDRGKIELLENNILLGELTTPGIYVLAAKSNENTFNYEDWPEGLSNYNAILEVLLASQTTIQRLTPLTTSTTNNTYFIRYKMGTGNNWVGWKNFKEGINNDINLINERINEFPSPDTILNNYGILGVSKGIAAETPSKSYPDDFNDDEDYTKNNDINKVLQTGFYFLPGTNSENLNRHYEYKNLPALISDGYKLLEVLKFTNYTII